MNKSGTSSQIISLPKGGGALHGIGEKFSPDLQTGTGNFTVPIALPPGRNGFQPQLNLSYSTGNGNGFFGLGWSLSIPGVMRKTSKGIPRYQDYGSDLQNRDTFILSGTEDLVPVDDTSLTPSQATRYRPRTEGLFANIIHHHDAALKTNYWQVASKDGLTSFYGTNPVDHPQYPPDWHIVGDPAVTARPQPNGGIFSWKLTLTTDPFGNRIEYLYERDQSTPADERNGHQWDQPLLKQIRYVDYEDESNTTKFLVTVTFQYESRPDPFSEYRPSYEIRTTQRCREIIVTTDSDTIRPVRSYRLGYEENLPTNGASLLRRVQVVGFDDAGVPDESNSLPPLEFAYSQFVPHARKFFPVTGLDLPPMSLANPSLELVSLFGSGLPDIIEMNGTVQCWRNLGNGQFDRPRSMPNAPPFALADRGVQMLDANGDGRTDLLVTTEAFSGYFPLTFDGRWDVDKPYRYRSAPSFNLEDPEVKLLDLNGDGVTDAIRSGTRLECFFNDPHDGWTKTRWVERQSLDVFPNVTFSDPRVKLGDMTGDGLQDIVLVYDGTVEYWPNHGHGEWGTRLHMRNSPRFPAGYDPKRILIGDVDGDGLADIVYVDDHQVTLWMNHSGNRWSEPISIHGTPAVTDVDAVRLVDLLGTGVSGVLWSADASVVARPAMYFLDFTGGVKPYLLNEMNNNLGAVTKVGYTSSTSYYLEDRKPHRTQWKTPLPFPVQVVARVEVIDQLSQGKLTTEYRYHHGYWDGAEREFRGFGMVEQLDTESFETYNHSGLHDISQPFNKIGEMNLSEFSPPTLTKTWFHLGPVGEEFGEWQEQDWSNEWWRDDPPLLDHKQHIDNLLVKLPRKMKRDALRSLRGSVLRTELYALDGSLRQLRPYTVSESAYEISEIDPPADPQSVRPRIFFPHVVAQRTTQWERGDDPLTQFTFTSEYDDFGHPQHHVQLACPRGWKTLSDTPDEPYLATLTHTTYAKPKSVYIHERVAHTTRYELTQSHGMTVLEVTNRAIRKLIGQTINYYDGPAFTGLTPGEIGKFGALVRSESLAFTVELLRKAYQSGSGPTNPPEPPYLTPTGSPVWTAVYPHEFRQLLPTLAGYVYQPIVGEGTQDEAYFIATEQKRYDFQQSGQGRGLLTATRDPLNHETTILSHEFQLLPTQVQDPVGLITTAQYNLRVLQPSQITDANHNRTLASYSTLGLLSESRVQGKHNTEGDQKLPSVQLHYDFRAFEKQQQPVLVRTTRRVFHDTDPDDTDETILTYEYSDGFGRLLQTRTQAEEEVFGESMFGGDLLPADQAADAETKKAVVGRKNSDPNDPNVVVSGWQRYDNKGRVIEKFEPFFDTGWAYHRPTEPYFQHSKKILMFYDPRGQLIRTVHPDGSEQRVIHGVPGSIAAPDVTKIERDEFEPTPWETYTYDANDLAPKSFDPEIVLPDGSHPPLTNRALASHHFTPTNVRIDGLGRTIQVTERNGSNPATDWFIIRSTYDIHGNLLTVSDALEREAFSYRYDLMKRPWRIDSIDAGLRRMVLDAVGNEVERRDSKGALILHAYDSLLRPLRLWARDHGNAQMTLRERLQYGDDSTLHQSATERNANRAENRLGKMYRHHDEAGLLTFVSYDFKGNTTEKERQVIADSDIHTALSGAGGPAKTFVVNWDSPPALQGNYQTSMRYDALNRVKAMQYPRDVNGKRKELKPRYSRAGALERIELDKEEYVQRIAYNAKGQRTLVAYGNGVMTRYAYDLHTFRLIRLRTEKYVTPPPSRLAYQPNGGVLQDIGYDYDLAGNITATHDRAPDCGLPNQRNKLDRTFAYDPLYRLTSASGRECDSPPPSPPWDDTIQCTDYTKTRSYTQKYTYDAVGNLTHLDHNAGPGRSFNRVFTLVGGTSPSSNRLATVSFATQPYQYTYDLNGNISRENTERHFAWDHSDRLGAFTNQAGAVASMAACYLYDSAGQRVKKYALSQAGKVEVTVYIDGTFEHHKQNALENNTLHVMDNQSRIALVRVGNAFPDDGAPTMTVKYHLGDHLGSSNVVLGGTKAKDNTFINREEYFPYGETSFGSFAKKRYRFTGKERDEESSLYYYGARYYAPWLGRWTNCDPEQSAQNTNRYVFNEGSPTVLVDPTGRWPLRWNETHETITREAATQAYREVSVDTQGKDAKEFQKGLIQGVRFNDIPEGLRRLNDVVDKVESGKADIQTQLTLTYRSHFGDLQYWHSMAPPNATSANQIVEKIVQQASEWYDQANLSRTKGKVRQAGDHLGRILHMIQDSWSPAHTERGEGYIHGFQDYRKQDPHRHKNAETPSGIDEESWASVQAIPGAKESMDISKQIISEFLRGNKDAFLDAVKNNYQIHGLTYHNSTRPDLAAPTSNNTQLQFPSNLGDFPLISAHAAEHFS